MAEVNREVTARLRIEKEGEPEAFNQAAESVEALAGSAAGAEPSIAGLSSQLSGLASSVKDLGPAGEAFDRVAEGVKRFAEAKGVDEQREAVEGIIVAWKEFGEQVPDVLAESEKAARQYEETLENLETLHRKLADPLAASAAKAREELEKLSDSTEGNFAGAEKAVERVRNALNEYRRALEAAGDSASTEKERAELDKLEKEYDEAVEAVGKYRDAKKDAKEDIERATVATSNEGKSINDLGDVAKLADPKLGKLVGTVALMTGALLAGFEAGEKLREFLNWATDGGFDRFVQETLRVANAATFLDAVMNKLAGGTEDATRKLEELANQRNIFDKLGIPGFSSDLEKNAEILAKHAKAVHDDNEVLEEFAKKIGLSSRELAEQSRVLVASIESFTRLNPQIDQKVLQAIVKEQIQPILDAYAKLGIEPPKALLALASAWRVTTTSVETESKRHAAAVQALAEKIVGVSVVSIKELQQRVKDLAGALSDIDLVKLRLEPESFARAKAEVQGLVDLFRVLNQDIPPALEAAADAVQVFIAPIERASGVVEIYTAKSKAAADSTVQMGVSADGARKSIEDLTASNVTLSEGMETGREAIENIQPVAAVTQISLEDLKDKFGATGRAARDAGKDVATGSQDVKKGAQDLATAGTEATGAGDALGYAGDQANAAAPAIDDAGSATQLLGSHAKEAAGGVQGLGSELDALRARVVAVQALVSGLAQDVAQSIAGLRGFSAPLLAEIDEVLARVAAARAEILSLAAEDGGGSAVPPALQPQASHG